MAIVALGIGFFIAGFTTKMSYPCNSLYDDPTSGCIEWVKAIMRPGDLFSNRQDSLARFLSVLVLGASVNFVLLMFLARVARSSDQPHSTGKD